MRALDRDPVNVDKTPHNQRDTDLCLVLSAIDQSLDAQAAVLSENAAELVALKEYVIAQGDTQREILRALQRIATKTDRIDELDEVRGSAARARADLERHLSDPAAHQHRAAE